MTDAQLVAVALQGSEDAFKELARRYERPVYALILRMVQDRPAAEDLAQDTFLGAFRRLGTYDAGRKFSSWLFSIARHRAIDHFRRTASELGTRETARILMPRGDAHGEDPRVTAELRELGEALKRAMSLLPPHYALSLRLFYFHDASCREISATLGCPSGTVKTYLHLGRKVLAQTLAALGWGRPNDLPSPGALPQLRVNRHRRKGLKEDVA